jgi:RNA polymerase sigma factor (sigma-70 family)
MINPTNTDDSFINIYQQYKRTVFGIAFNYTKSNADACDIVQEVFIKYIAGKNPFNGEEHIKAWLIRVTINECKKHLMSSWIKRTVSLEDQTIPFDYDREDLELFEAVMSLPLNYRTPIHLHYYEGYTISEIASLIGARESTVKVRLLRARKMLKHKLKEVFNDEHQGQVQKSIQSLL